MAVLFVLVGAWALARGLGWAGVGALDSWAASARIGLAAMFTVAGVMHFTKARHEMAKMVPPMFSEPMAMVYFTGVCEILGAMGILIPGTMRIAGLCLAVLLMAMFPANIRAAREKLTLNGKPVTPLPQRIAMQVFFVAVVLWSTGRWV